MIEKLYQNLLKEYKNTKDEKVLFKILKLFNIDATRIHKDSTALFLFNEKSFKYEDNVNNMYYSMRILDGIYEITYYEENGCKTTKSFFLDNNEPFYSFTYLSTNENSEATVLSVQYKEKYEEYSIHKEKIIQDDVFEPFAQIDLVNDKKELVLETTIINAKDCEKRYIYNNDLYYEKENNSSDFMVKFGPTPINNDYILMTFDDSLGSSLVMNNPVISIDTCCNILGKERLVCFDAIKVNSHFQIEIASDNTAFLAFSEIPFNIPVTDSKNITSKDIEILITKLNDYAFSDHINVICTLLERIKGIVIKKENRMLESSFRKYFNKPTSFDELANVMYENIDDIDRKIDYHIESNESPISLKYRI